jgi:hypothetical protein
LKLRQASGGNAALPVFAHGVAVLFDAPRLSFRDGMAVLFEMISSGIAACF